MRSEIIDPTRLSIYESYMAKLLNGKYKKLFTYTADYIEFLNKTKIIVENGRKYGNDIVDKYMKILDFQLNNNCVITDNEIELISNIEDKMIIIKNLEKELKKLGNIEKELNSKIKKTQIDLNDLEAEIRSKEDEIREISKNLSKKKDTIINLSNKLNAVE